MTHPIENDARLGRRGRAWPAEFRAVVGLLRCALGTADTLSAFAGDGALRPGVLNALLDRHRIGAFLRHRLPAAERSRLPAPVQAHLDQAAQETARRALVRSAELVRLSRVLGTAGVPFLSVKGPLLARELYGELGLRHAGDLDLLVRQADAERVDGLLRAAGFRRTQPSFELTPLQQQKYFSVRHEFEYFSADGSLRLEVMWRLVNHEHFHRSTLGEASGEAVIGGQRVAVLPTETAALHLLLHGADHGWFRLFWLLDIALLMQNERIDWPRLLARAEATKLERVFWQSVLLTQALLAVPLPAGLPAPPQTAVLPRLVSDALRHMELTPDEIKTGTAHWWMTGYAWRLQSSWRVRLRALLPRVVNPADWQTLPLPDRWFTLYYVLWPFLWAKRRFNTARADTARPI